MNGFIFLLFGRHKRDKSGEMLMFTSFAGIRFGTDSVHGFGESSVRFHRNGSKAHGTYRSKRVSIKRSKRRVSIKTAVIYPPPHTTHPHSRSKREINSLPVTKRLTISAAGSTSSNRTADSDGTSSSCPRSVHCRKLAIVDSWKRANASRLLFLAASYSTNQ